MSWTTPKINWVSDDGVTNGDFNRIEGNVLDNHERLVDIEDGSTKVPRAEKADISVHSNVSDYIMHKPGDRIIHVNSQEQSTDKYNELVTLKKNILNLTGKINIEALVKVSDSDNLGYFRYYLNGTQVQDQFPTKSTGYVTYHLKGLNVKFGDILELRGVQPQTLETTLMYAKDLTIKVAYYSTDVK